MDNTRLTKRIFNVVNGSTQIPNWCHEIEEDLKQAGIDKQIIGERGKYRDKIMNVKFKEKENKKTGTKWTNRRKQEHSQRMKRFWEEKKKKKS